MWSLALQQRLGAVCWEEATTDKNVGPCEQVTTRPASISVDGKRVSAAAHTIQFYTQL
jgi:hypothetical protein